MADTVQYTSSGYVGTLILSNPDRHNSLGKRELDLINGKLQIIAADPELRVLVLTGAGDKTFCAGASLDEMNSGAMNGEDYQNMTDSVAALRIPTICALNGNVFGGGVELALSCDFRIGIEGTRMRVPAAAIGLCYPLRGIQRIVHKLGVTVAQRVLVASETFSAVEMRRTGIIDQLVTPEEFSETVNRYATDVAALAPLAVRAMKSVVQQAGKGEMDWSGLTEMSEACANSSDLKEGFSAAAEKRKPTFFGY